MGRKHWEYSPDHKVSFGKFYGTKWRDLPESYLKWFAEHAYGQMVNRRSWAVKELSRRKLPDKKEEK